MNFDSHLKHGDERVQNTECNLRKQVIKFSLFLPEKFTKWAYTLSMGHEF